MTDDEINEGFARLAAETSGAILAMKLAFEAIKAQPGFDFPGFRAHLGALSSSEGNLSPHQRAAFERELDLLSRPPTPLPPILRNAGIPRKP
jgi:hypothetical protein